ncbi:tRNA Um(44) 2'-O-methyltransferase [Coniochaeta hoffmannii]|uniref:tRNA (uracil-O(2)-)-methyltransferase n=1 Tax=Coniochaeta hoffmannii TaxID=91930 RepID=A0AA38VMD7_9PEZI|nr:tRNA Um(44) 2'-O-methyltransferase [Coniochaeta hoffmannii]
MATKANEFAPGQEPLIFEDLTTSTTAWTPLFWLPCSFDPAIFTDVMLNLIKNPNINSSWLFRADILHDEEGHEGLAGPSHVDYQLQIPSFSGLQCKRYMIRKLIPRNTMRDSPLDQTCLIYEGTAGDEQQTLVVYLPHVSSPDDMPFYHPMVRGIAFLHRWNPQQANGSISISYLFFPDFETTTKLTRTALHLVTVIHKHGEGRVAGYVKRVHHDVVIPQAPFQNRYASLKQKYAKQLIDGWAEATDPLKHVFEDLGIAAFLIELWADMYANHPFPGFVDIGCGNGLLVYILNREGYIGWGFDARARKSWEAYSTRVEVSGTEEDSLRQAVLVPSVLLPDPPGSNEAVTDETSIHNGLFPLGTFIISNHADELTPWTPILAAISRCPFVMIPCCSHNLTGAKYRAPPPKDKTKSESSYSSLVAWVEDIARDCGWEVETEMLRIPSTRNTALLGRKRAAEYEEVDVRDIIQKYGGAGGWLENAMKLVKTGPRGH